MELAKPIVSTILKHLIYIKEEEVHTHTFAENFCCGCKTSRWIAAILDTAVNCLGEASRAFVELDFCRWRTQMARLLPDWVLYTYKRYTLLLYQSMDDAGTLEVSREQRSRDREWGNHHQRPFREKRWSASLSRH